MNQLSMKGLYRIDTAENQTTGHSLVSLPCVQHNASCMVHQRMHILGLVQVLQSDYGRTILLQAYPLLAFVCPRSAKSYTVHLCGY